jgi:hypothetical protein
MKPDIDKLARQHGFEVERTKKHKVFKRADGATLVLPSTPSDHRSEQNSLTDLAGVLGVPRKNLLHIDHKPLRALRPHAPLPKHENPVAWTKESAMARSFLSFLHGHMQRAANSLMFLHSYASTSQEHFDANQDAVLQMARNLRGLGLDCDAVFCMKVGGDGDGHDCVELRIPVTDGGTFVCYLDPAVGEIHLEVPFSLPNGDSYEPCAYAGDWFS